MPALYSKLCRNILLTKFANNWSVKRSVTANYSNAVHSLKVAEQIEKKRQHALLGGGEQRIKAQHKKVQKCFHKANPIAFFLLFFACQIWQYLSSLSLSWQHLTINNNYNITHDNGIILFILLALKTLPKKFCLLFLEKLFTYDFYFVKSPIKLTYIFSTRSRLFSLKMVIKYKSLDLT